MTLLAIADQKASMLMAVASVMLALVVRNGTLVNLKPPLLILTITAFLAALSCMIAVLPAVGHTPTRKVQPEFVPNLLFFGVFADLSEADFRSRMRGVMASDVAIYDAMPRDVHQQGLVLKTKKYRFLGYAYRIFIVGIVLTLAALLAEFLI
ncbi:MAG: hypothetical protein KGQ52_00700 [Alphaproteobacteria bacterium]|nr:hypothetical protein [Alphaproteobacteria bacterium]